MKRIYRIFKLATPVLVALCMLPAAASAHQPRIVEGGVVRVTDPEVSKAYYDTLTGESRVYVIEAPKTFSLYLNISVPRDINPLGRYTAKVSRLKAGVTESVAMLTAGEEAWKPFFEPFGRDWYLQGPELKMELVAGMYRVEVSSEENAGKYVLAVGEKERFPLLEILNAGRVVPKLKSYFFGVSPATFALSIFGGAYLALMLMFGAVIGFVLRGVFARLSVRTKTCGRIGGVGRSFRAAAGIVLSAWAVTTSWNPLMLLLVGFLFYESLSGWCGLRAVLSVQNRSEQ